MKYKAIKAMLAATALATFTTSISAATATGVMNVSATVAAKCTLDSVAAMAFGTYTQGVAPADQTANIQVTCPANASYTLGIDSLVGGSRFMASGGNNLEFNLYIDAARTQVWGNSAAAPTWLSVPLAAGGQTTHVVYGRVFDNAANQALPAGNYNTTVNVTLTF